MSNQQLPTDYLHLLNRDTATADRMETVFAGRLWYFSDGVILGIPDANPAIRLCYIDGDVMATIPEPDITSATDRKTFADVATFAALHFGTLTPMRIQSQTLESIQQACAEQRLALHQTIYAVIKQARTAQNQEALDRIKQRIGQEVVLPYMWHANPELHTQRVNAILQQRIAKTN